MNRPIRDYDVKKLMLKLGRIYKKESKDGQNTIKKEMGMGTPNLRAWRACIVFIHMPVCNLLPLISILENHDKKPKSPHEFLWGRLQLLVSFCLNHMHSYSGCKLSLFFVPLNLLCFCFIHTLNASDYQQFDCQLSVIVHHIHAYLVARSHYLIYCDLLKWKFC